MNATPTPAITPTEIATNSSNGITPASVVAIGVIFTLLPGVAVVLRFYCRLHLKRAVLGLDDWLMLAAMFLTLGLGVMMIVGGSIDALAQPSPQGEAPGDYANVTNPAEINTEKIFYAFVTTQNLAIGLVKLSILYLYRRIFQTPLFRRLSAALIVIVVIWTIAFVFAWVFGCGTNVWAEWAPLTLYLEYCRDPRPYFDSLIITDVITDIAILSLPYYWIWHLNISVAKRLAIIGVFLLGALDIAVALVRLAIYVSKTKDFSSDPDSVMHVTILIIWSMVEISIAVIAGCLPPIWPLVGKMAESSLFRRISRSRAARTSESDPQTAGPVFPTAGERYRLEDVPCAWAGRQESVRTTAESGDSHNHRGHRWR